MNKIKDAYKNIKLTDEEKRRMYYKIKAKAKEEKVKTSIWNYKKLISVAAVFVCAIVIATNSSIQVKAGEYLRNIAKWITGNSANDYIENLEKITENNDMKFTIESVQRVGNEVKVKYKLEFPYNIEEDIKLNDKNLFETEMFDNCKIYVDDQCIVDTQKEYRITNSEYWYDQVRDIELKNNMLRQELVIGVHNMDTDIEISFDYKSFKVGNKNISAELTNRCILPSKLYEGDINIVYIDEQKAKIGDDEFNFYGYAYTKTGIRIYEKEDIHGVIKEGDIMYLNVTDNFGRKYLFEKTSNAFSKYFKYTLSEDAKKVDSTYSNELSENISKIKVEVMHEYLEDNTENKKIDKILEFDIDFEK